MGSRLARAQGSKLLSYRQTRKGQTPIPPIVQHKIKPHDPNYSRAAANTKITDAGLSDVTQILSEIEEGTPLIVK